MLSSCRLQHLKDIFKAGDLPRVKSLLSLFIMTIKNDPRSLGFIKMNVSAEEMHLLTYSSLHALTVNSQLPVFSAWFLAGEFISIRQRVSGFTAENISVHCQCLFLCCTMAQSFSFPPKSYYFIMNVTVFIMMLNRSPAHVATIHQHCTCFLVFLHCEKKTKNNLIQT